MKLSDIFLFSREFYRKLTDNRLTLIIGILLVGMRNIGFYIWGKREEFAPLKPQDVVFENLAVVLGFVVLIGLIDVIFFSFPVFDLGKLFKKREENPVVQTTVIRMMKVYILANLIVTPLDLIFVSIVSAVNLETASYFLLLILQLMSLASIIWYLGVISRGFTTLFNFKNRQVMFAIIFIIALFYNHLLGYAYDFIYQKGLMVLIK